MNLPRNVVECAIRGGWKAVPFGLSQVRLPDDGIACHSEVVCDPNFWKALGKELGLGRLRCVNCRAFAVPVREKEEDPEYWTDCCARKRLEYGKSFAQHAHDFLDLLLTEGDTAKFWQELLPEEK